MTANARLAFLALCAAAPYPKPLPGLAALADSRPDLRLAHQAVIPRIIGGTEEIVVFGHRAPTQADPHSIAPGFRDTPESLQAYDLWALHPGSPPCCTSPYDTDIGGQPGLP